MSEDHTMPIGWAVNDAHAYHIADGKRLDDVAKGSATPSTGVKQTYSDVTSVTEKRYQRCLGGGHKGMEGAVVLKGQITFIDVIADTASLAQPGWLVALYPSGSRPMPIVPLFPRLMIVTVKYGRSGDSSAPCTLPTGPGLLAA